MPYRPRQVRSPGALLVLLWNMLVFSYHQSALASLLSTAFKMDGEQSTFQPWKKALLIATTTDLLPKMLYPFAGWLADAKLGRYKVMRYSLWIVWVGSIMMILSSIVRYLMIPKDIQFSEFMIPVLIVVYIINAVGIAGFHVNIIPFGIDQMEGASDEQITSFLHWYYWTRYVNFGTLVQLPLEFMRGQCWRTFTDEEVQRFELYGLLTQIAFLTAALCLDFLFSSKLHKDVKIHNPVKKVKDISVFICRHDRLVGRRRAYTFTYSTPPTRSDFAKQSYGGPFEDDHVEEVTSFWRMVVFLLAVVIGDFLIQTGHSNYTMFLEHMSPVHNFLPKCKVAFVNCVSIFSFIISIPTFEFLIFPFVRNYVPRTKVRIGLGMCVVLLGLCTLLSLDVVGHFLSHGRELCMFYGENNVGHVPVSPLLLIPVIFTITVGKMLVCITALEFICAQAPHGMRGLVIGVYFMIYGISVGLLSLVMSAFALGYDVNRGSLNMSCGTLYLLGVVVLGTVGVAVYALAARCYKDRQRGGQMDVNQQAILEGYYEKHNARHYKTESL